MGKQLRCLLGWHKWKRRTTEDNKPYRACVHCGVEDVSGDGFGPDGIPSIGG